MFSIKSMALVPHQIEENHMDPKAKTKMEFGEVICSMTESAR
jgi:hypothetical protein